VVNRGLERYAIYCAVCHDDSGTGNGLVHQHALALKETKWVPPTNLLTQEIRDRPEGQIFQAISDGVRNMPGYKSQLDVDDRWAIVVYVRKLQATQPVAVVEQPPRNQ
jgi:mono/diheme cytochrome c family protein